jgi:hypothetical protein
MKEVAVLTYAGMAVELDGFSRHDYDEVAALVAS